MGTLFISRMRDDVRHVDRSYSKVCTDCVNCETLSGLCEKTCRLVRDCAMCSIEAGWLPGCLRTVRLPFSKSMWYQCAIATCLGVCRLSAFCFPFRDQCLPQEMCAFLSMHLPFKCTLEKKNHHRWHVVLLDHCEVFLDLSNEFMRALAALAISCSWPRQAACCA